MSLDLRGASFTNWSADDHVMIYSELYHCTVNGSAQDDEIWDGTAWNLLNGNGGDDLFVIANSSTASTINGGSGWDTLALRNWGDGGLVSAWVKGVEEIRFEFDDSYVSSFTVTRFESQAFEIGAANPFWHFSDADTVKNVVVVHMETSWFSDSYFSAAGSTFESLDNSIEIGILGSSSNDRIIGSTAGDRLFGQGGADTITGGAGSDTISFYAGDSGVGPGNRDIVLDFSEGDKIDLSVVDASTTLAGDQEFVFDTDGIFTEGEIHLGGVANTVIELYMDADAEADMQIVLRGVAPGSLSVNDFLLQNWDP